MNVDVVLTVWAMLTEHKETISSEAAKNEQDLVVCKVRMIHSLLSEFMRPL
jgi:hypothetical protein